MINREIEQKVRDYLKSDQKKIVVIFGARQVGKTTLLKKIFENSDDALWYNGDQSAVQAVFADADLEPLKNAVSGHKVVVIDEAQRIDNIGLKLKILYDNFGDSVQIVATGSSSFELANRVNEPLTGRKRTLRMFAPTVRELVANYGYVSEKGSLDSRLIYGMYPEVVTSGEDKRNIVSELASDNLYKDILSLTGIIKTDGLRRILQALALQIGGQVSINEISSLTGIDNKTVDKYISLLEQSFIIFRLPSFARNLRNELKTSQKIFFYDCGIRNAIVNDFRPIELRPDLGALFKNFVISELKKRFPDDNIYFWRTKDGKEVDYLLERDGEIVAVEVKWSKNKDVKIPRVFEETYSPKKAIVVNSENCLEVLAGEIL